MNQQSPTVEGFFDNTGGGAGAPSAVIKNVDDFAYGTVVDQAIVDKKKFGTNDLELDTKTGQPIKQLVVILQTELRNWQGVAKQPTNEDGSLKPPAEDDGRRAVYVAPYTNIHAAIGDAIFKTTGVKGPILNGATLGVKVVELKDTGKGNPLKIHEAVYTAPSASAGMFGDGNQSSSTPTTSSTAAAPVATPAPAVQPQAPAPAASAQVDPWTNQPVTDANKPPF